MSCPPAGWYLEGQEKRQLCSKDMDIDPGEDGQGGQSRGEPGVGRGQRQAGIKYAEEGRSF